MQEEARAILLLAEDDPDMAFFVCHEFEKLAPGWEVVHAGNGTAAVIRLQQKPRPRLLITDLNMPGKNGFELIEWARNEEDLAELPIYVFSSSDDPSDEERCHQLRADGFFKKTLDLKEMRHRFRSLIDLVETQMG